MNWKKSFGVVLILVGLVLMLSSTGITGFAVLENISKTAGSILGIVLVAGGVLMLQMRESEEGGMEKLITAEEYITRIRNIEPNDEVRDVIIDSSGVLDYKSEDVRKILGPYKNVITPASVLKEIHNSHTREIVRAKSIIPKDYEKYKKIAYDFLERTEKPQMYITVMPLIKRVLEGGSLTNRELGIVNQSTRRIRKLAEDEKFRIRGYTPREQLISISDYLERHCKVSEEDTDVLASAIKGAYAGRHSIIAQKDIDLRQAVQIIKKEMPDIAGNIDCVEIYAAPT